MHWLDPDYLPVTTGVVERFTINLDGDIDGLVLSDEILIHTPPHLSDQLKAAVGPGDSVRVRGVKPRGADLIAAVSVEKAGGAVVIDEGREEKEADSGDKPPRTQRTTMEASGIVRLILFAPKARPAALCSRTALFSALDTRKRSDTPIGCDLAPEVSVRGEGLVNEHGRVIEVREIANRDGSFEPTKKPKHEDAKAAEPDAAGAVA